MGISYNPRIVTDGLVLCLDAANPKSYPGSGNTWFDLSGGKNDGTLVNGVGYNSADGGSLVFDGVDDRGTFTTPVTATSPQTYEVWTNASASVSASDGYAYILHNNSLNSFTGSSYMNIGIRPAQEYFAAFNGAFSTMGLGITATTSNKIQIVLTWDGSTQKAYANGVLRNSRELTQTPQNFSTTTSFGDFRLETFRMIRESIYSIKIYSKALTAQEIEQNFNAMRGRYGI